MEDTILVPIAPAELFDKIAILEIKEQRSSDPEKLTNVHYELNLLRDIFDKQIKPTPKLDMLLAKLRELSANGWDIEDGKRRCEKEKKFDDEFIQYARGAFKNNDKRATVKKEINLILGSKIMEEKLYEKQSWQMEL